MLDTSVDDALADVQRRLKLKMAGKRVGGRAGLADEPAGDYFHVSRSLSASFIAALPLLAIYEAGMFGVRNDINYAAQFIKTPVPWLRGHPAELIGVDPILVLNSILIVIAIVALWHLGRKGGLHPGTFGGMVVESTLYALLLGPVALLILTGNMHTGGFNPNFSNFIPKVIASCGAGLYEELLFRVIVLGAIYVLAREAARLKPVSAGVVALVLSGAVFSAAHFMSPGEAVDYGAFLYRLFAGIFLGVIFLTRGFGIAAWTHALYDIYVLCLVAG